MLTYNYTAREPNTGRQVKANVQADSESSAAKLIRSEGLVPVDIRIQKEGSKFGFLNKFSNRVRAKDRVLFSRQLATLINAGLPLVQALRSVNEQAVSKPLKVILGDVIAAVEGGATLSSALGKYPDVFDQIYVNLVAAGEASGTLDAALDRLALQQEKDADLNSKLRGAMTYPVIVVFVMIAVVGFMVVTVLPQVKNLYDGLTGTSLPLVTRILLSVSDFIINYWWAVVIALVAMAFFTSRWARTFGGKQVIDKLKMKAWPFGGLFMKIYMARFSRTGTTLIASGVPLLQMLDITSKAVNNVHVEASIKRAMEKVRGGKALSVTLANDPNFLPLVPSMLKIGEQSGAMEQMLGKAADYYEKEVDNQIANISSIIEPVMMVMLGIIAFVIVAAVLLPIYGLAGNSNFTV